MAKQKSKKIKRAKRLAKKQQHLRDIPRCGLCGATTNLTKTECCGEWICDDEDQYKIFSYARNSCSRNHQRYTLCGYHFIEGHEGSWETCEKCRKDFEHEVEMYVYYGTNEYNFKKLKNLPHYEPTKCHKCGAVIKLAEDGYARSKDGYSCGECMAAEHPDLYG